MVDEPCCEAVYQHRDVMREMCAETNEPLLDKLEEQ